MRYNKIWLSNDITFQLSSVKSRNDNIECKDKDETFCPYYVRIYGDRFCDEDWFISDSGRYGCKLSCKLCEAPCEDKNERYCPYYVRIYGKRFCDADWFINGERYGCKKSCELC